MYSALRPEIRAAQRVLRSLQQPCSNSTHCTVRSFTSYVRLQAQSGTNGDDNKPDKSKASDTSSPKTHQAHELIQFFTNKTQTSVVKNGGSEPSAHPPFSDIDFTELARRGEEEKKEIDEALKKGEIPKGYKLVDNLDDVPQELKSLATSEAGLQIPFLVSEDPGKLVKGISLPKDFREAKQPSSQSAKPIDQQEVYRNEPDKSTTLADGIFGTESPFYGSPNARRKRARTVRGTRAPKEETPTWLLENNLKLTRLSQEKMPLRPGVRPLFLKEDGTFVCARAKLIESLRTTEEQQRTQKTTKDSQEDAEKPDNENGSGVSGSDAKAPNSIGESEDGVTSSQTLPSSRYYIDVHQKKEVANTFEGRLRRFSDPVPNKFPGPSASNHLAIYHTAKDADLLLYQLVDDMCKIKNADLLRLDAHDISALIAQSDVDEEVVDRGGRASFSIFKNIYGSSTAFFNAIVPQSDSFEDGMGEDDDVTNPKNPFDLPVTSFVAVPSLTGSKSLLDNVSRGLNWDALDKFLKPDNPYAKAPNGMFSSMIESLFTSTTKKVKSEYGRQIDERAKEGEDVSIKKKRLDHRPLVVHIPDVRAIQEHPLAGVFLTELLEAADASTKAGRHVMVVGTDCLRDASTSVNAYSILDVQENKPIPSATAIVLTPVFPHQDARLALLEDRKRRIATINARHLWSVLHSGRGTLLKGLEAGFWTRDILEEIGEKDYEALARSYLSYSKVQRLASVLNAEQFRKSQTPVLDAMHLIDTSDQGKLQYIRRSQPDLVKAVASEAAKVENTRLAQIQATATRHEKRLLSGVVEPGKISTSFKDIHIPTDTIETLQTLTTLSLVRPDAFRYGVLKSDRIPGLLLYGPPGTGKTLAAKAVAKESGATMLEVSGANLNDMYVGEGEKNVQALFNLAKKLSPCVVFLDEADAMFSARSAQGRRVSHRELLNQFLREWDGMSNDAGSAFIMIATNRPMDLDDAVLRRLPRRILVDLPTEQDRLEILKIHLRQENLADDVNMADIAKTTPFYSGSDLKNVAVAAALNAVREEHEASKKYAQENPDGPAYQYPEKRTLTKLHFEKALEEISASISEDMTSLKDIKKFDEQYGDKRGKRKKTPKWGFRSPVEADQKRETVRVRS